jgi:zinc protease
MKYEIERLKNDLEVIFIDLPGSSAATVQTWFRAGSTLEEKEDHGIAHFLEHMFFKGTPTRPGAMIAHEVESYGGEINAFTSFDYTCYYINTPNSHLGQTVDILLDMISNPTFKEEDLIPEREVVFEEYRRSQDNANQFSFQKIQKSCFLGGYSHPILGNEKTIKSFSRDQLINFRNKYYNSSNSFLVVAGHIEDKNKLIEQIESYSLPKGDETKRPALRLKNKPTLEIHHKDVRMCQLTLSIQSPAIDDHNAASEDLAYNTLGIGEASPLYKNLVINKALANSCSASTMFFSQGGVHFMRLNFPAENFKKVIKILNTTLKDVIKNGMSDEDIKRIKNQYVASKVYEKESVESFSFSLGNSYVQTQNLESDEDFINRIKKTSIKDVNRAFKEIFSRPIHMSLQIPKSEKISTYKDELKKFQNSFTKLAKPIKESKLKVKKSKYDPSTEVIELKPGFKLLYRYNPMTPTFVMHAYLKGGLTEETDKTNGIYNLTSSLLTKGYKGMTREKIKLDLEFKSAHLGSFSGKNAYGLTLHGQTDHFKSLFKHFMMSLTQPTFPQKYLTHEKKLVYRTLESQKEDAARQCFRIVGEKLYNVHPYHRGVIGTEKSVPKITKEHLAKLHAKNLRTKDIVITYCGDLHKEQIIDELQAYLKEFPNKKPQKLVAKKVNKAKAEKIHLPFEREQTQIFIGMQTGSLTAAENTYLKMLTTHLSGQSSELFVDVRDRKGLCYVAQPVHMTTLECGYWGIYMASGHDKVDQAIEAIEDIIERTKNEGLSRDDFERIKLMLEGQGQLNLQVNEDYANSYSVPELQGQGFDYLYKSLEKIKSLKYDEFQKGIKKALSKHFVTITVGR